ncbi:MAG: hypothetical protein AB7U79_01595 [Candidatus Izemoplasmatales bacterium]
MQKILSIIFRSCQIQLHYHFQGEEITTYIEYQGDFHMALSRVQLDMNDVKVLFVDLNYPQKSRAILHYYGEICRSFAPKSVIKYISFDSFLNPNEVTYHLSGDIKTETVLYYQNKVIAIENLDLGEGSPGSAKRIFFDTMRYLSSVLSGIVERTNFSNELIQRYHLLSSDDISSFTENCSKMEMIDIALLTANFSSVNQYAYRNFSDRMDEIRYRSEHLLSEIREKPIKLVFSGCLFDKNSIFKEEIVNQISKMGNIVEICDAGSLIQRYLERNVE